MVFYVTSANVKIISHLIETFKITNNVNSREYLKDYIEKCPEEIDDKKLEWITDTFLGYIKHEEFLEEVISLIFREDPPGPSFNYDENYLTIILYAIIFQLDPKYEKLLYKCMFNLNKLLLQKFTGFLVKKESLNKVSDIAITNFDLTYVNEKIMNPLIEWEPCLQKMADDYDKYVENFEKRRKIPITIPKEPNFTRSSNKEKAKVTVPPEVTASKASDVFKLALPSTKKFVTKEIIDEKIKQCHETNKAKATNLLNKVMNLNSNFAKPYPEKQVSLDRGENMDLKNITRPNQIDYKSVLNKNVTVKDTALTLKRLNRRIQVEEEKETQWLDSLMTCSPGAFDDLENQIRKDDERKRFLDIEKKHLLGQLSYEEAVIAKKKQIEENKKKHEEFLKEKQSWNEQIENWRKIEEENNKKIVEKLSLLELSVLEAKSSVSIKNKESAEKVKKESDILRQKVLKERNEELERRFKLIKELKILALVARQARVPKVIDLTETSGIGSFCEMSIAELQERLAAMKINIKEEIENKKKLIRDEITAAKQDLENTRKNVEEYLLDRAQLRKDMKIIKSAQQKITTQSPSDEINELKKKLEYKRKLRIQMSS